MLAVWQIPVLNGGACDFQIHERSNEVNTSTSTALESLMLRFPQEIEPRPEEVMYFIISWKAPNHTLIQRANPLATNTSREESWFRQCDSPKFPV